MQSIAKKEPVEYVNPNIGTIGHLLKATVPAVTLPHGMVQAAPVTTPGIVDRYLADKIYGFPMGTSMIMATVGEDGRNPVEHASLYDHDLETTAPHYYAVLLEDYDITVDYTVTARCIYYRFTFPKSAESHMFINIHRDGEINITGNTAMDGYERISGVACYFHAEFSKPFQTWTTWQDQESTETHPKRVGDNIGARIDFATADKECIQVRIGVSYISVEQACQNLQNEIPNWNFDAVKEQSCKIWNDALGKIQLKGGNEHQKTIFYTALYRAMRRMINITEYGKYYSGYDQKVHQIDKHDFYVNDGLWDTYRCMHPLQLLLEPQRQLDMIQSFLDMYEQSGWFPAFPHMNGDLPVMLGTHSIAMVVDTFLKGYTDFDVDKVYDAMKNHLMESTMLPWRNGKATELDQVYFEKGFFPALGKGEKEWVEEVHPFERRQAVSVTLEGCYDDWCFAQLAKALDKMDDYAYFMKRASNYRNLFNKDTGFMAPKTADGNWVEGFNPKLSGGQGGRDYFAECNSWIYTFHVQHDVAGLIELCGGRDRFCKKMDDLFVEQYDVPKYDFLKQFPDATGLIGQYAQGNEPSFHIPYLYNYAGQPWKTQRKVKEIMNLWYNDGPLGICGDEDGGAMSSWYVFSAMGFYPVCPGSPVYDIGSPIFEEINIKLGNGKTFTIKAENLSDKNKYIQSAQLNGLALDTPWFYHSDMADGGSLVLHMGDRPNKSWGSSPEAAPPSMSSFHGE